MFPLEIIKSHNIPYKNVPDLQQNVSGSYVEVATTMIECCEWLPGGCYAVFLVCFYVVARDFRVILLVQVKGYTEIWMRERDGHSGLTLNPCKR